MKILAINPPVEDFTAYNLWALPLGLLRIVEDLRASGNEVVYLDMLDGSDVGEEDAIPPVFRTWGRHSYWKREIKKPEEISFVPRRFYRFGASLEKMEKVLSRYEKPDMVFLSTGMTYWYRSVLETIAVIKKVFSGVPVFTGGIAATLIPHFFEQEGISVVRGRYAVNDAVTGTDLDIIKDSLFFPLNLVEGCPHKCLYCSSRFFHPDVKIRNIEKQRVDLEKWRKETGRMDAAFYDDALLLNKGKHLKNFLGEIEPGKYRFHTPNGLHLKEIDVELAEILKIHNFKQLRFGFETFGDRYDNKTDSDELKRVLEILRKAGFNREELGVYLLCGLPGQKVEDVIRSIDFVNEAGGRPYLSEFSPVPGTELFETHLLESRLDFKKEPLYQNNTLSSWRSPVFNPGITAELKKKIDAVYKKKEFL